MKIVKFLEKPGVLIKGVSEKNKNDAKVQKDIFLGMALGTLGASLLGNMLGGKAVITGGDGVIICFFEQVKEELKQVRIFNCTSSCN